MKHVRMISTLLAAALPLLLSAQSVSNGKATLEWKNGVMELRSGDGKAGKVIFRPSFTNGTDIKSVKAFRITEGKLAILLHGKDCSLTFTLDKRGAISRVSAPKNAVFSVETPTVAIVLPDGQTDDLILEPGGKARDLPPFLPFFMGLEGQGSWTLSCIPYLGRSDIRISADLKKMGIPSAAAGGIYLCHSVRQGHLEKSGRKTGHQRTQNGGMETAVPGQIPRGLPDVL